MQLLQLRAIAVRRLRRLRFVLRRWLWAAVVGGCGADDSSTVDGAAAAAPAATPKR